MRLVLVHQSSHRDHAERETVWQGLFENYGRATVNTQATTGRTPNRRFGISACYSYVAQRPARLTAISLLLVLVG
jgi:hypothetical protein